MTIAGTALLASCGTVQPAGRTQDDPFNFGEIQAIAQEVGSLSPLDDAPRIERLRSKSARVSEIYGQNLVRLEEIYGDGVGPAKGQPDYTECKNAFHRVSTIIVGTPMHQPPRADLPRLWSALEKCRDAAERWSGPAEMATFGNDLKAMAEGSMLVFCYAAVLANPRQGAGFYKEFKALEADPSGAATSG